MESLKKNQIYRVNIDAYSSDGGGVCRVGGRAVFIPGAIPGEEWEIKLVKVTATAVYARGERLIAPSTQRIEPDCPYYSRCGGCDCRHINYEEELRFKLGRVNDALHHIGKQQLECTEILGSAARDNYRNKGIFAVADCDGAARFGFYQPRSHRLVAIDGCRAQNELSNRAAKSVVDFINERGIPAYDEETGRGAVRHVFCRRAVNGSDAVVCIVSAKGFGADTQALVDRLRRDCPELTGIVLNINKTRGNIVLSGDFYTLYGRADMRDTLCGRGFDIAPQAFFQINPPQAERLYQRACEYCFEQPAKLVFDLYCGAGTISLCLARQAERVIGAEIVPEAIENARHNAEMNGVLNAEFICGDAGQAAAELAARGLRPDAVVVDPPRKGMSAEAVAAVASMHPECVVYVSCDPATLSRDILRFTEYGYKLKKITAVDMFPRTCHVETICLLSKLNAKQHIEINLDMDELDLTDAEKKATYQEIKDYVLEHSGLKVSSLYIAQVKQKCGIIERENYNKPKSEDAKQPQCPPDKEKAIKEALTHFGMI